VPNTEFKVTENVYINETTRLIRDRHGAKICACFLVGLAAELALTILVLVFVATGQIGRFSFQTMLVQVKVLSLDTNRRF